MDVLLKHVEDLVDHSVNDVYSPIRERIAYMVCHGQSYASNGYSIRTQAIAKALNEYGFDTLCFVRPGRPWELGIKKNSVHPEEVVNGVRYIHSRWLNDSPPDGERANLEICAARFIEHFKIYRPAVVLAASDYTIGLPAFVAAKALGLPFYSEVRGFWELSREAREPGYEKTKAYKLEANRNTFVSKQALKVFTLSQQMKNELVNRGLNINKISIIPNGVGELPKAKCIESILRQKLGINPEDRVVGYIGSFTPYEGLDTLIDACTKLSEGIKNFKLLLVGDDQPVNRLMHPEKKLTDQPWLVQLGRVPHEQIADYYALIDTVVIPRKKQSVCELVSPMKAVEALAYGKKLIVSDVVPLVEISSKYKNVTTFKSEDSDDLMNCISASLNIVARSENKIIQMKDCVNELIEVLYGKSIDYNKITKKTLESSGNLFDNAKDSVNSGAETKISESWAENIWKNKSEHSVTNIPWLLNNIDTDIRNKKPLTEFKDVTIEDEVLIDEKKPIEQKKYKNDKIESANKVISNKNKNVEQQSSLNQQLKEDFLERKNLTIKGSNKLSYTKFKVPTSGATLELSSLIVYELNNSHSARKAVVLFDFLDKLGRKKNTVSGIGVAATFKKHFRYLNENSKTLNGELKEIFKLKLPKDVTDVVIEVAGLGLMPEEQVKLVISGRCFDEESERIHKLELLKYKPLPTALVHDNRKRRLTSDLTIACILDEFTSECLSHEVTLVKLTQEHWHFELDKIKPDFLLVESCWNGNDGSWGAISKGSGGGRKLGGLIKYCKREAIPTVFWNKEDPPHYEKFGPIAKLFDLAITSDVNMVPRYKKDFGIDAYPLSFAAQPKIHNPSLIFPRSDKAVFAGSYYGDKPKRCIDFNFVMNQLDQAGLKYDIFDRNYKKGIEKFNFPENYQANIVGNLPAKDIWKVHRGYKYQINMNSVQNSSTMFARRVYESLASGTPIISNASKGMKELFGDVVIMSEDKNCIADRIRDLENSPSDYQTLARRGVRKVMRAHTYGHRLKTLCHLLGIEIDIALPGATLAITANTEEDIQRAKHIYSIQTAEKKHLFIELRNFSTAYKFLNESNSDITFGMEIAKEFYKNKKEYYGDERVLKCKINDDLYDEALEDFIYWGDE
ncbi:glycosyltransferase [Microbulbifer sp. CnH-101-E]|uniref:glycosyltransferase n=1 Tax=unclassified Microbulbifer TaxID=2619833 RepID=UPI0040392B9A